MALIFGFLIAPNDCLISLRRNLEKNENLPNWFDFESSINHALAHLLPETFLTTSIRKASQISNRSRHDGLRWSRQRQRSANWCFSISAQHFKRPVWRDVSEHSRELHKRGQKTPIKKAGERGMNNHILGVKRSAWQHEIHSHDTHKRIQSDFLRRMLHHRLRGRAVRELAINQLPEIAPRTLITLLLSSFKS